MALQVMGGPKIPMRYGRKDATGPDMCHPEGNLPAGEGPFPTGGDAAGHLRAVFHRMGFTDKDIVALSGAHTVGRVHSSRSGLNQKPETKYTKASACPVGTKNVGGQSWTAEWVKFDNSYYKNILDPKDDDLLVMASDACLVTDEKFKCATTAAVLWSCACDDPQTSLGADTLFQLDVPGSDQCCWSFHPDSQASITWMFLYCLLLSRLVYVELLTHAECERNKLCLVEQGRKSELSATLTQSRRQGADLDCSKIGVTLKYL
jgi:hypothetical protein